MCAEPRKNPGNEVDTPLCNFIKKTLSLRTDPLGQG